MTKPGLRRELGIWSAASLVVGTVIGSGIFLVPKTMVMNTGSPEMVLLVWIFGGLLSLAGALTYAEMAAALPEAGGEYVYLSRAYGPFWGFLYGWTQMWVAKSGAVATIATGFALYLANFLPVLDERMFTIPVPLGEAGGALPVTGGQLAAIALILSLGFLNWFGVKEAAGVQVAVTILKVALIGGVIATGLFGGKGTAANFGTQTAAPGGILGFFAALVAALWAYDGWNNLSMVSSEVKEPQRNLPRALILGTAMVMGIYLLTNVAYFYVLPAAEVAGSDRVASVMMRAVVGEWGAAAVSVAAMISMFAALNGSLLSGARVPYALARDGLFFRRFGEVSAVHHTPGFSVLALSGWSAVLVLSGRYDQLLTMVIFPSWILYGMSTAAVMVLRRKHPKMNRPYRTLGYPVVPLLFVGVAAVLLAVTLEKSPRESALGLVVIAAGIPFYAYWNGRRQKGAPGGGLED
ncbi:MAG: amino acid permease [Bryobacteraceae bacterium]|nr:amino acid permease [Bryobacteraceae bacterium]